MLGLTVNVYKARGFTLIELLVTLTIAAILSAFAAPAFTDVMERQRVRSAVDNLRSSLDLARSEAVKRNASVAIVRTGNDWSEGWEVREGTGVLYVAPALPSLTISSAVSSVQYNSSGRSNVAEFSLQPESGNSSNAYCVDISLSGRPRGSKGPC